MPSTKIHIVIQGCGAIAKKHAQALKAFPESCLFSFSSRDRNRAEQYRAQWGGQKAYGDLGEALKDPAVDVVLLCTPHDSHFPLGVKALEAGKHLLIEKPMALSSHEGEKLIALARTKNLHLNVTENYHYRPALVKLDAWIKQGLLGDIRFIRINKVHKRRTPPHDWRLEKASMGGGAFIDGGIHWVNVLQTLGGPFTKVSAHLISSAPMGNLAETGLSVVATLGKNAVGQLNYSWAFADYSDLKFFAVYGTEGTVYVSNTFLFMYYFGKHGHKVWLGTKDAMGFKAMWSDLLHGLKIGAATRMTAEKGLDDLRFVEAAYQECIEGTSGSSTDQKLIHNFS